MDLEFSDVDRYELADGTIVAKDVFVGRAQFDGQLCGVDVILTDSSDTPIGGSMMKGHILKIHYTACTLRLERSDTDLLKVSVSDDTVPLPEARIVDAKT